MAFWTGRKRGEHEAADPRATASPVVVAILVAAVLTALFSLVGWLVGCLVVALVLVAQRRRGRR